MRNSRSSPFARDDEKEMPTFLALQCYKCSMMQVKHDKQSSNKWSCSVCNEKQSMRKIFATSTAAKDIRKFVQDNNLSRNIAQDRVLAELVEKADEGGDIGFMGTDAPSFNFFGDEFSQHRIKTESKWTDYLSPELFPSTTLCSGKKSSSLYFFKQVVTYDSIDNMEHAFSLWGLCQLFRSEKGLYAETSEDALDDARFVTSIPEKTGRKPRGRAQAAAEDQNDLSPLQQPQGLSFTKGRSGKFSNKSIKSFRECRDDVQKENKSPSLWATKTSSGSSLRVQKTASMLRRQQLVGYTVPQVTVADVSVQGSDRNGERAVVQAHIGSKTNVASKMSEIFRGKKEKPLSKWATYLDSPEDASGDQRACAVSEQEKHVSKWAKYMDFDEAKPRVDSMENRRPSAKWENFLDASEEVFPKPAQPQDY